MKIAFSLASLALKGEPPKIVMGLVDRVHAKLSWAGATKLVRLPEQEPFGSVAERTWK